MNRRNLIKTLGGTTLALTLGAKASTHPPLKLEAVSMFANKVVGSVDLKDGHEASVWSAIYQLGVQMISFPPPFCHDRDYKIRLVGDLQQEELTWSTALASCPKYGIEIKASYKEKQDANIDAYNTVFEIVRKEIKELMVRRNRNKISGEIHQIHLHDLRWDFI